MQQNLFHDAWPALLQIQGHDSTGCGRYQTQRPHHFRSQRGSCSSLYIDAACTYTDLGPCGGPQNWSPVTRQKPIWNTELLLIEGRCANDLLENTSHLLVPTLSDNDDAATDDDDDDDNDSLYARRHPSRITQAG